MNDVLVDVLRDRAELAPDPDELWDDIVHGIEARRGRRRATVAAAGASAAVATAAITAVAVVPSRSQHRAITPAAPRPVPSSASVSSSPPRPAVPKAARLVPIKPPPGAKLVLNIAPEGWRYLGSRPSSTTYSNHAGSADNFVGNLVLLYGAPSQDRYPLEVGAHPGAIWKSTGYTVVEVRLSATRALTVQVPPALALSKTQLIKLAGSATVRAGAVPGRG